MIAVGKQTNVCAAPGRTLENISTPEGSHLDVEGATPPGSGFMFGILPGVTR